MVVGSIPTRPTNNLLINIKNTEVDTSKSSDFLYIPSDSDIFLFDRNALFDLRNLGAALPSAFDGKRPMAAERGPENMGYRSDDATPQELAGAFEKIGALIVGCSQLDVAISHLIAATVEMAENPAADLLIHAIDLSRKRLILDSYCSMFEGSGIEAIARLVKFSAALKDTIDDRNTVAHGLLRRNGGRLCIGSFAAVKQFRNTGKQIREEIPSYLAIADLDGKIARCHRLEREADLLAAVFSGMHKAAAAEV